jgi:hypothetical protein
MKEQVPHSSRSVGIVAITFLFGLLGCDQDVSLNYSEEESALENVAIGQNEAYDALEVDYQTEAKFLASRPDRLNPSVLVNLCTAGTTLYTATNDTVNKILTIDFGPYVPSSVAEFNGCTSFFERIRSGKIRVSYPKTLGDTVTSRIITFDSYVVNNKKIEDSVELTNIFRNQSSQKLQATIKFMNLKIGFPDGTSITLNGHQNRIWYSGEGDGDPTDNTYLIPIDSAGNSLTGVTSTNRSFSANLTSTVLVNFSCAIPGNFARTIGVVSLTTLSGFPNEERLVNYGTICDKTVTVITYRRTFTISVD